MIYLFVHCLLLIVFLFSSSHFQMDQYILDDTKYDAIIIGSSLSQTLLAAGLSRAGKKVWPRLFEQD